MIFKPKYITFDCYGTLTNFRSTTCPSSCRRPVVRRTAAAVRKDFTLPLDEVMGDWRPYDQILKSAFTPHLQRHGIAYRDEDGQKCYDAVPTWGPHADVPEALTA